MSTNTLKNVYLVQVNNIYGEGSQKSTYIPYAAGCLIAYCLQKSEITTYYSFKKIFYRRDPAADVVESMVSPYIVFFSCSVWNYEYNKLVAKKIKDRYPFCLIAFGGHHVSARPELLKAFPFIDFVIHQAGEEPTAELLKALREKKDLHCVSNLSFRTPNGKVVTTEFKPQIGTDYPSPYLCGVFDEIMKDDISFSMLFETNRGCPNSCAYCDWGALKSKVRMFSLERVKAEIDWFVTHKIDFIYCTDANFCLFDRDEEVVDYIIEASRKFGYPKVFHVNFTKNHLDLVFNVSSKMVKSGLAKAQTIAFQSLDPTVLKNVGRKNISSDHFHALLKRYEAERIPTYSELILGLPGETHDSFCKGICQLLEDGQHYAINVYPCELLPNSEMGQAYYRERFQIKSTLVPFLLMHSKEDLNLSEATEYAEYVTSTYSMDENAWAETMTFASFIQGLHNLGLTRAIAIYMRHVHNISYHTFYEELLAFAGNENHAVISKVYQRIKSLCTGVSIGKNSFVAKCPETGTMLWGFDELVFLEVYSELALFYEQLYQWLASRFKNDLVLKPLIEYQFDIIKKVGRKDITIRSEYDFFRFFQTVLLAEGNRPVLRRRQTTLLIHDPHPVDSFQSFACEIVWYGRNRRETDYTSSYYSVQVQ